MIGHIGCTRGPPSGRTVARKARPTPNWYIKPRHAAASSGSVWAKSFHRSIQARCHSFLVGIQGMS